MFYDIYNAVDYLFGRPTRVVFNTNNIKDMNPAIWAKTDTGYTAIVKTLGIENVEVTVTTDSISVKGENEIGGLKFDTAVELPVAKDVLQNTIKIEYETKFGLTFINLIVENHDRKIEIIKKN